MRHNQMQLKDWLKKRALEVESEHLVRSELAADFDHKNFYQESLDDIERLEAENKRLSSLLEVSDGELFTITGAVAKQAKVIEEIKKAIKPEAEKAGKFSCCYQAYMKILSIIEEGK